jgi:hypothetical protein
MEKIPTLFKRDPQDMSRVLNEVNPAAAWVLAGEGVATRKYDGTCVMLDGYGKWWARREVKPGKKAPPNYVPISTDPNTGKTMGWEPIEQSAFAKFHAEALTTGARNFWHEGTYELIGPKVNGNPEDAPFHALVRHAAAQMLPMAPRTYRQLTTWLPEFDGEGIVWHHPDGRMAKLKKRDFQ